MARVTIEDLELGVQGLDYAIEEYEQAEDEKYHDEAEGLIRTRDFLNREIRRRYSLKRQRQAQ